MADLTKINVRDIKFSVEDSRIQWRLNQWRPNQTLADLAAMSVDQLYRIPGLGKKSVNAIVEAISKWRNV